MILVFVKHLLFACWVILSADIFENNIFKNKSLINTIVELCKQLESKLGPLSELCLIRIASVCKEYQQMTKVVTSSAKDNIHSGCM